MRTTTPRTFKPSEFGVRCCEFCGKNKNGLADCRGVLVCEPCARTYGEKLEQYCDQLKEDLLK